MAKYVRPELVDCPSCGKQPRIAFTHGVGKLGASFHREQVTCSCGLQTKQFKAPYKASKVWNATKKVPKD